MGKNCPKHVELILEINKLLLLHPTSLRPEGTIITSVGY